MSINLSIEEVLNQLPEVKKALEENKKKQDEAVANKRGELIKQATEAEARTPELQKEILSAQAALKLAHEAIRPLEQRVLAAKQAFSDCRGTWKACMDLLAEKYGNREVENALVKLGAWRARVEYMAKHGIGSIEANRQRREHAIEVQRELEGLFYANGCPEEINQKITEAMSLIALDDLSND